ncbi:MAG TPA: hypothetical protein VFE02_13400 [Candidatus Acidoferrales bacterium]|jgi:hypothetical protein|nr:hypothetical protein [Candidatus Acidoferrales bacterium]
MKLRISRQPVKQGFIVRLLSPLGKYPSRGFYTEANALTISEDVCFSVVRIPKEDWSFSEVDVLSAWEIPLYGSVLLCGDAGTPYLYPYPSCYSVSLETDTLELIDQPHLEECKKFLLESVQNLHSSCFPAASFHKPPCFGGMKYDLVNWSGNSNSDRLMILSQLEASSPLALRSVNCLLKARLAWQHAELNEAACLYLWIALDGAHSLILQRLRESGFTNPTSADAARYFDQVSGWKTEWEKFFEDDYENRIRAFHPSNRVSDPETFHSYWQMIFWN